MSVGSLGSLTSMSSNRSVPQNDTTSPVTNDSQQSKRTLDPSPASSSVDSFLAKMIVSQYKLDSQTFNFVKQTIDDNQDS